MDFFHYNICGKFWGMDECPRTVYFKRVSHGNQFPRACLGCNKVDEKLVKLFLGICDKYCLLYHLRMYFGRFCFKQYEPRSDCSLRSSLNRVHSVCFHEVHLNIFCSCDKQATFSGQNNIGRIKLNPLLHRLFSDNDIIYIFRQHWKNSREI